MHLKITFKCLNFSNCVTLDLTVLYFYIVLFYHFLVYMRSILLVITNISEL